MKTLLSCAYNTDNCCVELNTNRLMVNQHFARGRNSAGKFLYLFCELY